MREERDPFDQRLLFLRVGWMHDYRGITGTDAISGGGAYVAEHGYGHEIFNFQPFRGALYGYVQPVSRKDQWSRARINLTRLGALPKDECVSGVLAVWVATSPYRGAFVIGWYKNATVYRQWQRAPSDSSRRHSGTDCGYYITVSAKDAILLPPDERAFPIPQQGTGAFGRSNIWYADDPARHRQLRLDLLRYIESGLLPPTCEAIDLSSLAPDRVATKIYRILRDTELARRVKAIHNYECQICGRTTKLSDGRRYAEAHHIHPLGEPHNGPDVVGNIVCLCPNHHAELDYGVIPVTLTSLRMCVGHSVEQRYAEYHNQRIHRGPGNLT